MDRQTDRAKNTMSPHFMGGDIKILRKSSEDRTSLGDFCDLDY